MLSSLPVCQSRGVGKLKLMSSDHKGWRYCGIIICVWNGLGFILTALFYFPPPRVNTLGKSRAQVLREIDYVGGLLMICGLVLFMAGMQWGGYQVCSPSAHIVSRVDC